MRYSIHITPGATRDLAEIYGYIAEHDSIANANRVIARLEAAASSLSTFPERGSVPRELQALGNRKYRQIFFKPYRLIYSVAEKQVQIRVIADGRRDMRSPLARRLLGD